MNQWILVANASCACLYSSDNLRISNLTLVKEFLHPDSRKKVTDLISDRAGNFKGSEGSNAAYEGRSPKDVEAEFFAEELSKELKKAAACKNLIVVSPAHFYGLLEKHLNCKEKIQYIHKDYTKYQMPKLLKALREHLFV